MQVSILTEVPVNVRVSIALCRLMLGEGFANEAFKASAKAVTASAA